MIIPENLESLNTDDDQKYVSVPSFGFEELKELVLQNLKPLCPKSKYKFNDQSIDSQELSTEGYYKLFGLKHIEYIHPEDALEVKAKAMLSRELEDSEEEKGQLEENDDVSKEMAYFEYLLQNFVIPENNVRKEKLTYKMKEDNAFLKPLKLQEYVPLHYKDICYYINFAYLSHSLFANNK